MDKMKNIPDVWCEHELRRKKDWNFWECKKCGEILSLTTDEKKRLQKERSKP